jgi:hypothetical protein
MKQQKPSPEEDPRTKEMRRKRAKQRFSETAREIQQDNAYADPDEVFADVTEAVEAVRK